MSKPHLAIRLPNWLGDVIMTLPTLDALSTAGFTFELFGKPWIKDLFSAYAYTTHPLPSNFWKARALYQNTTVNRAILLTNSLSSALHLALTGIKSIGYHSIGRKLFLHRSLIKTPGLHEIEYFWQLAQCAVDQPLAPPQNPKLLIADVYREQADVLLKHYQIQKDFFVICPGAIGFGAGKQSKVWPYWQDLCASLSQQGIALLACPAPFEIKQFEQEFGKYLRILPNINLPLYAAIMQRATQVIANDSGPMHMAAAVQAPTLGIFGQSDPQRCRPWGGEYLGKLNQWPTCAEVLDLLARHSQVISIQSP